MKHRKTYGTTFESDDGVCFGFGQIERAFSRDGDVAQVDVGARLDGSRHVGVRRNGA